LVSPARSCWPLACILAISLLLGACGKQDDAEAIRALIREGTLLAEKHDVAGIMKLTTPEFRALPGEMDGREARKYLLYAFLRYKEFKLVYPRPVVEIQAGGEGAEASFPFLILQKDYSIPDLKDLAQHPEDWLQQLGDKADLYRLRLEFTRSGGEWRVRRAHLDVIR